MSWKMHFRKSISKGPLRTTVSKNGASASVGIAGFRVTVSSSGDKTLTLGVPGTGLYWTKKLKKRQKP